MTFSPGYGLASGGIPGVPPSTVSGQLTLTPQAPAVLPGLATQRYLTSSNAGVGSTVQTFIDGMVVSVKIVAAVSNFPTVSGSGGGLIVDLGSVQALLAGGALEPAPVTQWWLATPGLPPGPPPLALSRLVPPGSAVTSASGTTAALLTDPLSTLPQQGLLAITVAAAVLAITGFCVSIAAGVRQRRAENALLAALGVAPRAAAGQLCLEKLMLSVPSALAGLVLGVVLAELLVPAITLSAAATLPVPPVLIQFGWPQMLLLALAVAVLPVLAAALTLARRPDAAAELRAAEAASPRQGRFEPVVGTAAGSALALALLVCGCVFAALAGPALSLHTRTQALHQTLAGYANTTKTVQVSAAWATSRLDASLPARAAA